MFFLIYPSCIHLFDHISYSRSKADIDFAMDLSLPPSISHKDGSIRPPDQAFSEQLIQNIPPLPAHYVCDWEHTSAFLKGHVSSSSSFNHRPKNVSNNNSKKRPLDAVDAVSEDQTVFDLTIDDSDDDDCSDVEEDDEDSLGSLTMAMATALKHQRLHHPRPPYKELRELRCAFFAKLFGNCS